MGDIRLHGRHALPEQFDPVDRQPLSLDEKIIEYQAIHVSSDKAQ